MGLSETLVKLLYAQPQLHGAIDARADELLNLVSFGRKSRRCAIFSGVNLVHSLGGRKKILPPPQIQKFAPSRGGAADPIQYIVV